MPGDTTRSATRFHSLLLTIIATLVLLSETELIGRMTGLAADPTTSENDLLALSPTLVHSVGGLVVLLLVQVLDVFKPQGLTPYGWRRQQEQRQAMQPSKDSVQKPQP